MILKDHKRPDGREITQIRPLAAEVDIIPRVHGSAMFTRGQTQICDVCTLAPLSEQQKLDGLDEHEVSKRYMLSLIHISTVLKEYERQGLDISRYFMEEFIRSPEVAADFDAYYRMDRTCMGGYRISELFAETVEPEERRCLIDRLSSAGPDVRCMFIRHFLAAASEEMSRVGGLLRRETRWAEVKKHLSEYLSACLLYTSRCV